METIFLTPIEKGKILEKDNVQALNTLLNEIDRLESIIRDYEIVMRQVSERYSNPLFKTPKTN